jgi:hypothetical protein
MTYALLHLEACWHSWKLQMLQSKCLCTATSAVWCYSDRAVHEVMGILYHSIWRRHHSTDWELKTEINWCGEPLSSVAWRTLVLTKGWLVTDGGLMLCGPVDAVRGKEAKSAHRLVWYYLATMNEGFSYLSRLWGMCQGVVWNGHGYLLPVTKNFNQTDFSPSRRGLQIANAIPTFLGSIPDRAYFQQQQRPSVWTRQGLQPGQQTCLRQHVISFSICAFRKQECFNWRKAIVLLFA